MLLSISPSTQEHNRYTDGSTEEANMNKMVDDILPYLKAIPVIRNDRYKDAKSAIRFANQKRANLHLSLHSNAGGGTEVEAFYDPRKPGSMELAKKITASLAAAMGLENRGIKDGLHLVEIRGARKDMDSVLVECFYHDNPSDVKKFRDNYHKVINEIAWQIKVYFGVK